MCMWFTLQFCMDCVHNKCNTHLFSFQHRLVFCAYFSVSRPVEKHMPSVWLGTQHRVQAEATYANCSRHVSGPHDLSRLQQEVQSCRQSQETLLVTASWSTCITKQDCDSRLKMCFYGNKCTLFETETCVRKALGNIVAFWSLTSSEYKVESFRESFKHIFILFLAQRLASSGHIIV